MANLLTPIGIFASNSRMLVKASAADPTPENPNPPAKFFCRLLFTPENVKEAAWQAIREAVMEALKTGFGPKYMDMVKEGSIRVPFRRDLTTKGYDTDLFSMYLNLNAYEDNPPAIIDRNGGPLPDIRLLERGARARASVAVGKPYEKRGNKGVNLYLRGVQYAGPRPAWVVLPSGGSAADDFGALEGSDVPANGGDNIDDLLG